MHALKVAEGVATVIIALYVAYIGTRQWVTAREKLRLDLYNRRFDVYLSALDFMQSLMVWAEVAPDQRIAKRLQFIRSMRESRFLFADDLRILRLLEEFHGHSFKVTGFQEELKQYFSIMPKETMASYNDMLTSLEWIGTSIQTLEELLNPYLAFRQ
jgi:hypothetical protein